MLFLAALVLTAGSSDARLPQEGAPLRRLRVFVDAGHGAPGNDGNSGCFCQPEHVHTLQVAQHLAAVLRRAAHFEVKVSRTGAARPRYQERIAQAKAFKADFIVSIHSDVRGFPSPWGEDDEGRPCWRNDGAPGFAVLWSEEGSEKTVAGRRRLGRAIGRRLEEAGFLAYSGEDYGALYRQDSHTQSGWVDIRPLKKRVYFLRGSTIPTVIVETHHALDPKEVEHWNESVTLDAFASATAQALLDAALELEAPSQ